jgi:carboxypeptidase C (cathepsin A)
MKRSHILLVTVLILSSLSGFASGQEAPPPQSAEPKPAQAPAAKPVPQDKPLAVTRHTITIGGKPVAYTATAGWLTVNKSDEQPGARIYFTAYTLDGVRDLSARPITFCFNGGPGSSSVWIHLGGLGPRRVAMNDDGVAGNPPYGLTDNENTLLDATDLVFIDPVSTGFSRPLPGEKKEQFHGIGEDVASVGEFIRSYVTKNGRWVSPKFILGESYGTTRAAGLSGFLQGQTHGMYLNGIVLVSSVLDFQTISFVPGSTLSYVLFFPHYTATAWYHGKLAPALQARPLKDVLAESEKFALDEYSVALFKGNRLAKEEYESIAAKIAGFTGLSLAYVKGSNLRIEHGRFVKELLRADMRTVGRLDSRFKGRDADAVGENYEDDPAGQALQGAFATMINYYLRTELQVKEDLPYAIYGNVFPWNFMSTPEDAEAGMRPGGRRMMTMGINVAETLRGALAENPALRVFVANGYYDGATPYFGTAYTFSQMGLNGEFADRVKMGFYEAGHMMYIHKPSLLKFKADVAEFIRSASGK